MPALGAAEARSRDIALLKTTNQREACHSGTPRGDLSG